MQVLIGFILIYLSIIGGATFISSIFNKKIEKTIAINIGIIILLLYIFGIFNLLLQGVYITATLSIILGIIAIFIKKKEILKLVFTPGFAFFSIVYIVLMGTMYNRALLQYDQYLYRSLNVKMMFNTNSLFQEYERLYQPVSTLIEYFFMILIGVYKQGIEAFALQIFGISLLLPMFENVKNSKLAKFTVGFTIICLPAIFGSLVFYESSYPDATLGLLFAYLVYVYVFDDSLKFKALAGIVISMIMVLTKPTGIAFMLIITCMLAIYEILKNEYYKKINVKKIFKNKSIIIIFVILLSSLLAFISWKVAVNIGIENVDTSNVANPVVSQPTDRASASKIEHLIKSYVTTVFGNNEENNGAAESNKMFLLALYVGVRGFSVPVVLSFITTSIIIFIGYAFYNYKTKDKQFKNLWIISMIGFVLFLLFLQLYFAAGNTSDNFVEHYGLDRYAQPYLLGILSLLFFCIFKDFSKKEFTEKKYIIVLLTIILITPLYVISDATITSGIANIDSQQEANVVRNRADKIDDYIEEKSSIITITQKENKRAENYMLRYYLYPNHKTYTVNLLSDESKFKNIINNKEYQYIYIYYKNEKLEEILKNTFKGLNEIKDETLYRIKYNEDSVELIDEVYINCIK